MTHPILFVGAGPGDPDLLTRRAARALEEAEVVLFDRLVSAEVLALCGPDAKMVDVGKEAFGPSTPQARIDALLVAEGLTGARVVRLKSGDPTVFGRLDEELDAVTAAGLEFEIVPGITAASAAVASIGQSLTRRGRNTSARLMTAHDMEGFADHDWRALARPGAVAAIYMGKRAARYLQGRLMMFGASPDTPVTAIANASRADEVVVTGALGTLVQDLDTDALQGPALILFGLAPRDAQAQVAHLTLEGVL